MRSRGFSIVELMIVVVIISVLATIAVPSFTGVQDTDYMVKAGAEVQRAFAGARSRSILRNAAIRLIIDHDSASDVANIRVDESPNSSCDGWPVGEESTAACDVTNPRCGFHEVHVTGSLAFAGYRDAKVSFVSIRGGDGSNLDTSVICMNRRGRMLLDAAGDWQPIAGGVRILMERQGLGLERELWIPQGGVSGVWR